MNKTILGGIELSTELTCHDKPMIKRSGPYGEFMSCANFPSCRKKSKMPSNQESISKAVAAFADDGNELEPDKLHLAQKLMKYYHFCTKASLRQGGFDDAFKLSPDIIELPENFWEIIESSEDDTYSFTDERGHDVYRTFKQDTRKNPVVVGSMFIVGKIYRETKDRNGIPRQSVTQICAPLLYAPATLQPNNGNMFEVIVEDFLPQLNHKLLDKVFQIDRRAAKIYSEMDLEEFSEQIPFFPLKLEEAKNFLDYLKGHFNLQEIAIPELYNFSEPSLKEEKLNADLRIVPGHALLIGTEIDYLTVVGELERLAEWSNFGDTALEHGFLPDNEDLAEIQIDFGDDYDHVKEERLPRFEHGFEAFPLSPTQKTIKDQVRKEPLVTVTGPPGTGKSHTAAAIALDHVFANKSVLFSSNTQEAIKVLVKKLQEYGGEFMVAESGSAPTQRKLADTLYKLLTPGGLKNIPTQHELDEIKQAYEEVLVKFAQKTEELQKQLSLNNEKGTLDTEKKIIEDDGISIADDISKDPEKIQALVSKGETYINGNFLQSFIGKQAIKKARKALNTDSEDVEELGKQSRLLKLNKDIQTIDNDLLPYFDRMFDELQELNKEKYSLAATWINKNRIFKIHELLDKPNAKKAITYLIKALRTRQLDLKAELLGKVPYQLLLAIFPVWASKDNFLSNILPLKPKMFDCVIIDEASFCRANSAIPALYRGEHAVVIGDPKQLRPIYARLSKRLKKTALTQSGLTEVMATEFDFQDKTIFDIASSKVPTHSWFLLDEHYRSAPAIIGFSKTHIYDDNLRVMTGRPTNGPSQSVEVINVDGVEDQFTKVNHDEVKKVMQLIDLEIQKDPQCTIGIITPFKEHRDFIEKAIVKNFTQYQIDKHELVGRTVYQMQGDERDVIILSTCFDKDVHAGRLRYFQGTQDNEASRGVFNVAITRARKKQYIVTSVSKNDLPAGFYKEYLEYLGKLQEPLVDVNSIPYKGEQDVYIALSGLGLKVNYQFESCGYKIDFVVSDGRDCLAIEYDGPQHFNENGTYVDEDIQRHLTLKRAGWDIYRIPYDKWANNRETCLKEISQFFQTEISKAS